jgi:GNAT superfamily N-acetyltransferase
LAFCQGGRRPLLSIEQRGAADADELFRMYGEVFGASLTHASRRRWQWQYLENPARADGRPEIWVAREDGRLLGQYASMPVRLWWGAREVRSSWGMDVFVAAEARGRGLGARLFTAWSDHVEVALGLGLTPSSYGLFQKLRYHDVGPVPFFQKVLDARAVARRRLGPLAGPVAAPVLRAALAVVHPERGRPAEGVVATAGAGFTEEYDALWERARGSYAMCVRRDRAYLDWKYARCPHRQYAVTEARRQGRLDGFAVTRHEEHRGLRLGWVIDVFADAADHDVKDALLGAVLDGFRRAGVARAQAFSMNAALASDLRRRGFASGKSPMQFCVRTRVESADVLADLGRWHVVFGDSDMDR